MVRMGILLWELCKGNRNVRILGFTAKIGTGHLQDTDCTVMLVRYIRVQYSTVQYNTVQYSSARSVRL